MTAPLYLQQAEISEHKVSVVVPSYNHGKYISAALESVARQSFTDYEMIVLDDASADDSVEQIRSFLGTHPEISSTFMCHEKNRGGVITLNTLIQNARGEYIALINSDDLWVPEKLAQQVAFLDDHPSVGAVFTHANIIDDAGSEITKTIDYPKDIFIQENRSRGKWLRKFFYEQNCLCHPSILIRRSVYEQIGLYNPRLRQLPDMEMWIRLLKHMQIHIIDRTLVSLRFHQSSTSRILPETVARNLHEISFIAADFFSGIPDEVLIEGFGDLFRKKDARSSEELSCEKAFLYFAPDVTLKTLYNRLGLQQLYTLMGNPEMQEVLRNRYHFDYSDFFILDGREYNESFVAYNRDFLLTHLRQYSLAYYPLLKIWRFLRGKRH